MNFSFDELKPLAQDNFRKVNTKSELRLSRKDYKTIKKLHSSIFKNMYRGESERIRNTNIETSPEAVSVKKFLMKNNFSGPRGLMGLTKGKRMDRSTEGGDYGINTQKDKSQSARSSEIEKL